MTVVKDESINKREVVVMLKAFQVINLIRDFALSEAGLKIEPGLTYKVDLTMKSRDCIGYERDTESLAEGARVRITIDRDYKESVPDAQPGPHPFEHFGEQIKP